PVREGAELVLVPAREGPGHHREGAVVRVAIAHVGRVDRRGDGRWAPALDGEAERLGFSGERAPRGLAHALSSEERLEDVDPDVAVPERPVRVRGDDAASAAIEL